MGLHLLGQMFCEPRRGFLREKVAKEREPFNELSVMHLSRIPTLSSPLTILWEDYVGVWDINENAHSPTSTHRLEPLFLLTLSYSFSMTTCI